MEIHHDCEAIIGTVLRGMIIDWINKTGKQLVVSAGPPVGEWYAPQAQPHKAIDKEIIDHVKQVIRGEGGRGR